MDTSRHRSDKPVKGRRARAGGRFERVGVLCTVAALTGGLPLLRPALLAVPASVRRHAAVPPALNRGKQRQWADEVSRAAVGGGMVASATATPGAWLVRVRHGEGCWLVVVNRQTGHVIAWRRHPRVRTGQLLTRGKRTVKMAPWSGAGRLATVTCPPCARTSVSTMANPRPLPPEADERARSLR